jgi:uncharacterized protein (TIGR03083 family)
VSDRHTVVKALNTCWTSLEELLAGLDPDDWQAQSLCPDWTVQGVVAHLTSAESALVGWMPGSVEDVPFGTVRAVFGECMEMEGSELAERLSAVLASRRADLSATTDEDFDRPSFSPVGPTTYGGFMRIRTFDFWVHERDIAVPLGRSTDDSGVDAEVAFGEVERALGYIMGKLVGLPDGRSVRIRLSGGLQRDVSVAVDGRAAVVDPIDEPDVELHADFLTFMLLACGRIDPEAAITSNKIRWTGDDEIGGRAARNLRFTM